MSAKWDLTNMPSQSGKTFLTTGAIRGLGFETTKELAKKGAKVVMTARNQSKGERAIADIQKEVPNADLVLMQLDLADLKSVEKFANNFKNNFHKQV